jgi:hypothetical protein
MDQQAQLEFAQLRQRVELAITAAERLQIDPFDALGFVDVGLGLVPLDIECDTECANGCQAEPPPSDEDLAARIRREYARQRDDVSRRAAEYALAGLYVSPGDVSGDGRKLHAVKTFLEEIGFTL